MARDGTARIAETAAFLGGMVPGPFSIARPRATRRRAADSGAYFVLSQGSAPQARPATHGRGEVTAIITANAAAISGYTVNVLSRNGADETMARTAKVAAPGESSARAVQRQAMAAAAAAMAIRTQTTAR